MPKAPDPVAAFLDEIEATEPPTRCWVCRHPEAREQIQAALRGAAERGLTVPLLKLGTFAQSLGYPHQPASLSHHLKQHDAALWSAVRV